MNDTWHIIIADVCVGIMTVISGWIACTLTELRKDLKSKMDKADCNKDMGQHCKRLDRLEGIVEENTTAIAVLTAKIENDK